VCCRHVHRYARVRDGQRAQHQLQAARAQPRTT
jgi:hypothetical protein